MAERVADSGAAPDSQQSQELETYDTTCQHYHGGSELDCPLRLRYIRKRFPEAYRELDNIREDVVGRFVREINRESWRPTKKYSSEVYVYRSDQQRDRMLSRLHSSALGYPGRLLLWCDEGDHIHVVHDCPFSNGQCRCYFSKTEDFRRDVRSPMRRLRYLSEMDTIDWTNVFLYFLVSKRQSNTQVWIAGKRQRLPSSHEVVRWRDLQAKSGEILAGQAEGDGHNDEREVGSESDCGSSVSTSMQKVGEKRRRGKEDGRHGRQTKFQRVSQTVSSLLSEALVLPASHVRDVLIADERAKELFDPGIEKYYQASCDLFTRSITKHSFADMYNFYLEKNPIWYANNADPFTYYHDIDTSVKYLNDLLKFQYNDDESSIRHLLSCIRDWFNNKGWDGNIKINCICIVGPPNSGKNYFWDTLAAIAYNVGHIGRVNNKTNQFALQECYGRRLVMGNEISMEEGAKEDFKKLCEGKAFNIRVKYQGDKIFTRAPVILISNRDLDICYDRDFKDVRLKTIRWNTCGFLKDSNKQPYPLSLFYLFDKYNISYD